MPRESYAGTARKLLLALDVGTTFSGVSYSILDPGEIPEIRTVTRFPAQEQSGGDSKIPSILYYDRQGNVKAAGAEAVREGIELTAEDEGWTKVEWFKLHLRPKKGLMSSIDASDIPPLAVKKTVVEIFADYVKYLFDCSKSYIQETHANGASLWESVEKTIDYVFTHPNGWEGPQQTQMRQAAVLAGLISDDEEGRAKISFVTEGEASLHFCINSGLSTEEIVKQGEGIVIVDAGGGTIDISSYQGQNGKFEEIAAPRCTFQGAIFVTTRAKAHLEKLLRGSSFEDDISFIADRFDKRTKTGFRDDSTPQYIKFATPRENDSELGIRFGQLRLSGSDVAAFFKPSVDCIVNGVKEQCNKSRHLTTCKTVLLVGGFAASDWLYAQVTKRLQSLGIEVYRPDGHTNKAVSDGGASFYLDRLVRSRVSKAAFGVTVHLEFDASKASHRAHSHLTKTHSIYRYSCFMNMFWTVLNKDVTVAETREFRRPFVRGFQSRSDIGIRTISIIRYKGLAKDDIWIDDDPNMCDTLCLVEADYRDFPVKETTAANGAQIYQVNFDVIILFGLTELRAQVAWKQGGEERRTSAKLVYAPDA